MQRRTTGLRRLAPVSLGIVALSIGLALAGCAPAVPAVPTDTPSATATAPQPVTAVDHAKGEQSGPVDVAVAGSEGTTVTVREITLAPGASTGVHCHHGQLIGVVTAGELTHYAAMYPGGVHVYKTGDSLVEGAGYRHEGRNEGTENLVLWVTYIIPEGEPLAVTDLSRCDP